MKRNKNPEDKHGRNVYKGELKNARRSLFERVMRKLAGLALLTGAVGGGAYYGADQYNKHNEEKYQETVAAENEACEKNDRCQITNRETGESIIFPETDNDNAKPVSPPKEQSDEKSDESKDDKKGNEKLPNAVVNIPSDKVSYFEVSNKEGYNVTPPNNVPLDRLSAFSITEGAPANQITEDGLQFGGKFEDPKAVKIFTTHSVYGTGAKNDAGSKWVNRQTYDSKNPEKALKVHIGDVVEIAGVKYVITGTTIQSKKVTNAMLSSPFSTEAEQKEADETTRRILRETSEGGAIIITCIGGKNEAATDNAIFVLKRFDELDTFNEITKHLDKYGSSLPEEW